MKYFILSILFMLTACTKVDVPADTPGCVKRMIRKIKREPVRNPPAYVAHWEADGEDYYYVTSDCCDQFNFLYDGKCNEVCAPDGGNSGTGDGMCPGFGSNLSKTIIWEDKRKR